MSRELLAALQQKRERVHPSNRQRDDLPLMIKLTRSSPDAVDFRGIALAAIQRAKNAGESHEMMARWISEDIRAALATLRPSASVPDEVERALAGATSVHSGPDGDGTMRVVVSGFPPREEAKLFHLLSAALASLRNGGEG